MSTVNFIVGALSDRPVSDRFLITVTDDPRRLFVNWRRRKATMLPVVCWRVDDEIVGAFSQFGFSLPHSLSLSDAARICRRLPVDGDVLGLVSSHSKKISHSKLMGLLGEWAEAVAANAACVAEPSRIRG